MCVLNSPPRTSFVGDPLFFEKIVGDPLFKKIVGDSLWLCLAGDLHLSLNAESQNTASKALADKIALQHPVEKNRQINHFLNVVN